MARRNYPYGSYRGPVADNLDKIREDAAKMASLEERAEAWWRKKDEENAIKIGRQSGKTYAAFKEITGEDLSQYVGTSQQCPTDRDECECEDCVIEDEEDFYYGFTKQGDTAPGEGGWYSRFNPQPIEVIEMWNLDHHRASIIQYLVRSDAKGGTEDLHKARWYLDRLIAIEEAE